MARPVLLRRLVPALLLLIWVGIAAVAGPMSAKISEVQEDNNASFLPASAESTEALDLDAGFTGDETVPAIVVWERGGGLTEADRSAIDAAAGRIGALDGVAGAPSPVLLSEDGAAAQVVVPLPGDDAFEGARPLVEQMRVTAAEVPRGLSSHVTGPGGFVADLTEVFGALDGQLLVVTGVVVLVILLVVYRSPVFVPVLLSAGLALILAQAAAYQLAKNEVITLNGQSAGILLVLVFGAGTDYALLLISRYKEELHVHQSAAKAMQVALLATAGPVIASGATVVVGLLCLLLSDLNSNRSLGPTSAVGIVAAMLAMLTFLPAALLVAGRRWFWPFVPRVEDQTGQQRGVWWRIAKLVGRRPMAVALTTSLLLGAVALLAVRLDADGIEATDQFVGASDAVDGQEALLRHFPGGSGSPVTVYGPTPAADALVQVVSGVDGVAAAGLVGEGGRPAQGGPPLEVDGRVLVQATLTGAPDSPAAEQAVRDLRVAVDEVSSDVLVGGTTAVNLDIKDESGRDNRVIIPVVLAVIFVILGLLLRSVVAPVLLVATVVLSFFSTLGVCAVVFRDVLGFEGVDPSFPLFAFVFLVALGIDYNIFLMTRVREESWRRGTRAGTLHGLAVTGGVITSAGVVLAATFAALGVLPLVPLAQIGFAVAFGVLLDTLVVRSLLVPAVTHLLGDRVWWPSAPPVQGPEPVSGREPERVSGA